MNPAPLLASRDRGSRLLSGLVSNGCPCAGLSIALNRDLVSDLSLAGISHHSHNLCIRHTLSRVKTLGIALLRVVIDAIVGILNLTSARASQYRSCRVWYCVNSGAHSPIERLRSKPEDNLRTRRQANCCPSTKLFFLNAAIFGGPLRYRKHPGDPGYTFVEVNDE